MSNSNTDLVPLKPLGHGALVAMWREWMADRVEVGDMSADTAATYARGMERFCEYLAESGAAPDWRTVEAFKIRSLGTHSQGTVGLWLASVRSFYRWAVRYGHMISDPAAGITAGKRRGANKAHSREPLTDDEARALLALDLPPRDSAIISMMLYCAMRGVAIRRADLADLTTRDGEHVLMVQEKGDAGKEELKVIPRPALLRLQQWLEIRGGQTGPLFTSLSRRTKGARLAPSSLREIIGAAFKEAHVMSGGNAAGKAHRLRHTAITNLLRVGGSLRQAQVLAGHADLRTTMIYAHEVDRTANAPEKLINYGEGK